VLLRTRWSVSVPLLALILVTAGAVGNYLDRVFRGYVVDFVHLRYWPVFNVADVYITVGGLVLAWAVFAKRKLEPPSQPTQ
jgi:signal peptidase II